MKACENCFGLRPAKGPDRIVSVAVVDRRDPENRRTLSLCQGCRSLESATWRLRSIEEGR